MEWGLSDEKDAVDHSSPYNNDNPIFFFFLNSMWT